ncbi:MAG: VOC family protein [Variovorax sp.]|nr:MAG: VOC family protein [Variovorax sp.]
MSPINAYLTFNGNAAQAMRFYAQTLGAKLQRIMTMGDIPADEGMGPLPPGSENLVMHAAIEFNGGLLMASDGMPGQPYEGMKGFGVALEFPSVAEAQRVFDAFAQGGQVTMPMAKTFWVESFGMVTDRFGTPWLINGGAPSL